MQLSIFTFTCGSHEIQPRRSFWITVRVHQVDSTENGLSIESLDAFWGRVGAKNECSQRAPLCWWSSWSWKLEEIRTEGDEIFCDVCAICVCRNIPHSRIPYHGLWLSGAAFSQLYSCLSQSLDRRSKSGFYVGWYWQLQYHCHIIRILSTSPSHHLGKLVPKQHRPRRGLAMPPRQNWWLSHGLIQFLYPLYRLYYLCGRECLQDYNTRTNPDPIHHGCWDGGWEEYLPTACAFPWSPIQSGDLHKHTQTNHNCIGTSTNTVRH